ncbi:GGDEF domain-containing protein [Dyella silvatica]|uniref:GGDEF domain-containing protein n=1 Tax=Dyella silvatica TaxID=2992128 RepID=UPI0022501B84|nr:GGDEF domain-containing protein [Dyella silvatica]
MPKTELTLAGAFLALHAVVIAMFPQHAMMVSYPFLIAAPLLATATMLRRCFIDGFALYKGWILAAISMLLWTLGMLMSAGAELLLDTHNLTPAVIMLVYIQYGVPITYAASGAHEERESVIVRITDAVMAMTLGGMFYLYTFSLASLHGQTDAHNAQRVVLMFDLENLFLAVCCTIRYLAAESYQARRMFGVLTIYTVSYLVAALYYNHVLALDEAHAGSYPALWVIEIPFLLAAAFGWRGAVFTGFTSPRLQWIRIVRSGSPLMLALAVLLTSLLVLQIHFYVAVAGIVIALIGYGLRSTLTQARHIEMEDALRHDRDELEDMALEDSLTQTPNRRAFDLALHREYARAVRTGQPVALLMIDIDHFKWINDRYGHLTGDHCLRTIATELRKVLRRPTDLLARFGGEEFSLLLPDTDLPGAQAIAALVNAAVRKLAIANPDNLDGIVTVSIGVAISLKNGEETPIDLLMRADKALYQAKHNGRDRVEYADMPEANA